MAAQPERQRRRQSDVLNPGLTVTLSGSISGSGTLVRAAGAGGEINGTLIINNPCNTFSGGFTLQSLGGNVDVQGASTTVSAGSVTPAPWGRERSRWAATPAASSTS